MNAAPGDSFAERTARERAKGLLDEGTFRELLGPFARVRSPHLAAQGVAAQSDDGVVVARGMLERQRACVVATDGRFLGGSLGEIGGAKIAGALELAVRDAQQGTPTRMMLAFDTGGIRLQEANLGLLAIGEICDAIVALRSLQPVVAVIAGRVGVYGGMSIATSLCDAIVVTEGARIGLNGPDVVETEAGVEEFDSRDRPLIWCTTGGTRRFEQGFVTVRVEDDVTAVRNAVCRIYSSPRAEMTLGMPVFPDPTLANDAFLSEYGVQP